MILFSQTKNLISYFSVYDSNLCYSTGSEKALIAYYPNIYTVNHEIDARMATSFPYSCGLDWILKRSKYLFVADEKKKKNDPVNDRQFRTQCQACRNRGQGGGCSPDFGRLTLFQLLMIYYAHHNNTPPPPPDFQTFRRLCGVLTVFCNCNKAAAAANLVNSGIPE